MKHFASPSFWDCYQELPNNIRNTANKNFQLLKTNPQHPSLHLKKVTKYWSVRAGRQYRSLGIEMNDGLLWFWIGKHKDYETMLNKA